MLYIKKIKKSYENSKFEILAPTQNKKLELLIIYIISITDNVGHILYQVFRKIQSVSLNNIKSD